MAVIALIWTTPVDAKVYFTQTQVATGAPLDFSGSFFDATRAPSGIPARTYHVAVSAGSIDEVVWSFDRVEAALWWESFPPTPIMSNGEEYDSPGLCDVTAGGTCDSGGDGTLALAARFAVVTQPASPPGFDHCAAVLPGLVASNFVGVSADCAETYSAHHDFDVFVDAAAGPVTLTVTSVPEPGVWALLVAGFAIIGAALRRVRRPAPSAAP